MRTYQATNDLRFRRAKEKVDKLKGFYTHLTIYLIFIPFFIFLNVISTRFPWALFPIFGWGIGVVGHAIDTFGWNPLFGRGWEERKIEKFMEEDELKF
ncbi:2TM domain-containing protein [Aureitalea sp. L0-47]|uniref:2TM domain-containing protein n=1 Tax=Aureitalea sp. L0-47 TaxID=2816962 RepID=UPI002237BB10|nr:2TM domain-containing protein [Aureitalea sp. L0-47]MCW5519775.1 2TM domain-containing protein [Aureitalea sp. L0-47]